MITIYQIKEHKRSAVLMGACARGLRQAGHTVEMRWEDEYRYPESKIAVFYGYTGKNIRVLEEYPVAIYLDMGYWGRTMNDRFDGYHKVSVNARHPTEYFRNKQHDDKRFKELGIDIKPWRMGENIVLAGMSAKGSEAEGYRSQEWETQAAEIMLEHTKRRIHYRPKPSWGFSRPIPGTEFRKEKKPFIQALDNVHAVVSHHSNCAVDAIVNGAPAFVMGGVAKSMASQNLSDIDNPYYPEGRYEWCCDIAYTQWNNSELASPEPWRHLDSEGLLDL